MDVVKCREEGSRSTQVVVQEIGEATFLQFDDNMVNISDLAKYRKVYIANSKIMYVGNIIVSAILLLISLFSKSIYMIIGGVLALISSFGFFFSLRMINQRYNHLIFICVLASFASCVLNVISGLYESNSGLSMLVLFITFIYYIMIVGIG